METCCEAHDSKTATTCTTCEAAICGKCRSLVNGKVVCTDCREQIEEEVQREHAGAVRVVPAYLGGLAGALIGGAAWATITIVAETEYGAIAILVGWLAGQGVYHGSGKRRGPALQMAAVVCSLLGLLLGRYFTYAAMIRSGIASGSDPSVLEEFGYFSANMREGFRHMAPVLFSGFDILWIMIAIGIAWGIPKATDVRIVRPRRR